jgi:hypothetical protein
MNAQFGKTNMIDLTTGQKNGLGVVAAEGYRAVSSPDCPASERLSSDCRSSQHSLRCDLPDLRERLDQSLDTLRRNPAQRTAATIDAGAATFTATPAVDSRLPAPAWAAFVLNHALCG